MHDQPALPPDRTLRFDTCADTGGSLLSRSRTPTFSQSVCGCSIAWKRQDSLSSVTSRTVTSDTRAFVCGALLALEICIQRSPPDSSAVMPFLSYARLELQLMQSYGSAQISRGGTHHVTFLM